MMREVNAPFTDKIKLPKVPKRRKRVFKKEHIKQLINQIELLKSKSPRFRTKAAVLLAATSGLRSTEVYRLTIDNIDVDRRIILIKAEIAKDFEDRVAFFNLEAQQALKRYLEYFSPKTDKLFPKSNIRRAFKQLNTDLRLKHMRKFSASSQID